MPFRGDPAAAHRSLRRYKLAIPLLHVFNALVAALVVLLCVWQSLADYSRRKGEAEKAFTSAMESFCLFARSDMQNQQAAVTGWARFIEHDSLELDDALAYLANVAASSDFHIHLIDADTMRGHSARYQNDSGGQGPEAPVRRPVMYSEQAYPEVDYQREASAFSLIIPSMAQGVPGGPDGDIFLSAPFVSPETNRVSLAFCAHVLIGAEGPPRLHIIVKVIEKDALGANWKVSDSYRKAGIALLDKYGDYMLRSGLFGGDNFWDFLMDNNSVSYFDIGKMRAAFQKPRVGLLELGDAAARPSYYVGCTPAGTGGNTFVACISRDEVIAGSANFRIALTVLAGMLVLLALDGWHLLSVYRKLKESTERAERESRFKTEFLSSMSHDIRTPMNAIMGLAKILRLSLGDREKEEDCLDKIELSGRHLLTLINDVLDISKIESEGVILSPAPFSLRETVEEIRTLTETQCRAKDIDIAFSLQDIRHDTLLADELRIKQVFMNLLSNAIKYTPNGGRVRVQVSEAASPAAEERRRGGVMKMAGGGGPAGGGQLQESFRDETCLVRYVVSDTGIGMSGQFMKTMYQAFSREVDTRVNKTPGTGLGLAIVRQLVDMMGGTIDCQSRVGEGTTFTVELELPVARKQGEGRKQEKDSGGGLPLNGTRVLIAEDNDINWEIESELLSYQGISSDRAENGRVCVDKLLSAPPKTYLAVLMDMQMPVMGGIEAAKAIREMEDPDRRDIPIIAVTANAFVDDVRLCLDAGMDAHVCKPVNVDSVLKAIREACGKRRPA